MVVELLSQRALSINRCLPNEEGGVHVSGIMLSKAVGLYAARVCAASNMTKSIKEVSTKFMQLDKNTMEFIIDFPGPIEDVFHSKVDEKYVEIYVRTTGKVDQIKYGGPDDERV